MAIKISPNLNGSKRSKNEKGNAIIEFISFLLLTIVPVITFFSWTTKEANLRLREEELFYEVIRIVKSGHDFSQSVSIANRYLTLHNSSGALFAKCIAGDCPHRGSRMQISFINGSRSFKTIIDGGSWN